MAKNDTSIYKADVYTISGTTQNDFNKVKDITGSTAGATINAIFMVDNANNILENSIGTGIFDGVPGNLKSNGFLLNYGTGSSLGSTAYINCWVGNMAISSNNDKEDNKYYGKGKLVKVTDPKTQQLVDAISSSGIHLGIRTLK
jgi:hypothetical protein